MENFDIFYASNLAAKCMIIFRTYINMMGDIVKKKFKQGKNPFLFNYIKELKHNQLLRGIDPCVVLANPGMLQSGISRDYFEMWCQDEKNCVIFTGYCCENTFGKKIQMDPNSIQRKDGAITPVKLQIYNISFSAHADFRETSEFIEKLHPKNVILVHGFKQRMFELKNELQKKYKGEIKFFSPENCAGQDFLFDPEIEINVRLLYDLDYLIRLLGIWPKS